MPDSAHPLDEEDLYAQSVGRGDRGTLSSRISCNVDVTLALSTAGLSADR